MKSANFPRIIWKKRGLSKKSFEGNSKGFSGKTAKKKIPLAKCYNNFRKVYFMHKSIFTLYFTYYLYGNCLAKNRKPVPSMNPQQKSTTLSRKNIFKSIPKDESGDTNFSCGHSYREFSSASSFWLLHRILHFFFSSPYWDEILSRQYRSSSNSHLS